MIVFSHGVRLFGRADAWFAWVARDRRSVDRRASATLRLAIRKCVVTAPRPFGWHRSDLVDGHPGRANQLDRTVVEDADLKAQLRDRPRAVPELKLQDLRLVHDGPAALARCERGDVVVIPGAERRRARSRLG